VGGPPITVSCECGQARHVPYGETWRCEGCGRRWNTAQIPAEEYRAILREMRRFRLVVIALAAAIGLLFALLGLLLGPSIFVLLPVVLGAWFLAFMPWWRRRMRRRARSLPTWQLRPE
jgi:Flp pilus assembly protein TadB